MGKWIIQWSKYGRKSFCWTMGTTIRVRMGNKVMDKGL